MTRRRGLRWAASAVLAAVLLLMMVPNVWAAAPTLVLTTAQPVEDGATLDVSGSGYSAESSAFFYLDDDETGGFFATLPTDGVGDFAGSIVLPTGLADGPHILDACRPQFTDPQCPEGNVARVALQIGSAPPPEPAPEPAPEVPPTDVLVPLIPTPGAELVVPPTTTPPPVELAAPPATIPPVVAPAVTATTTPAPTARRTTATAVVTTTFPAATTTTSPPMIVRAPVVNSAPSVAPASADDAPAPIPPYEPAAHARTVVELQVAAFTLLALVGLAPAGAAGTAFAAGRRSGSATSAKVKHNKSSGQPDSGRGDLSRSWRLPGTMSLDRLSFILPTRIAPSSPLLARVLIDASYVRAIFGSASALLPALGVVLGIAAVVDVGGAAVPPSLALMILLVVLGVFDALAGLVAVTVFTGGVVLSGGIVGTDSVRTLLGLIALCFAAALIASAARPLRRPPSQTAMERWDRLADFAIASLVGAWAVQKMVGALPGLSGVELPIAAHADAIALSVLAAMVLRMLAETVSSNWYPRRLSEVHPTGLAWPGSRQRLLATALRSVIFVFVSFAFIGARWQWAVGGVLFVVPQVLAIYEHRFPCSGRLYRRMPRGIVKTVLMLIVGTLVAAVVFNGGGDNKDAIANAFVLLSLPGMVLSGFALIGREGEKRTLGWIDRIAGAGILAVGIWLVLSA